MKEFLRKVFQISYFVLFLILSMGIVGNIELDLPVPTSVWIIYFLSAGLTFGKIIYTERN